jgi:hypothetical protein
MKRTTTSMRKTKPPTPNNLFFPGEVHVWYRFHTNGCHDLVPVPYEAPVIGSPPDWWEEHGGDLAEMLGLNVFDHYIELDGLSFRYAWLYWAVEHGIAPGQLFQVAIEEPQWHKTSYEYDEWDIEWQSELLGTVPIAPAAAARRWGRFLRELGRRRTLALYQYNEDTLLIQRDTGAMYVRRHSYFRDGIFGQRRVSFEVRSARTHYSEPVGKYVQSHWGSGEADAENEGHAWGQMVTTACNANKFLCPEVIGAMDVIES